MRYDLLHPKALRAALIEHMGPDYDVPQERQVRRWISGDNPWPGWARKAVDEIHGTTKEAAPSSTRRLLIGVMALEAKAGVTPDELSSAEAAMEAALEVDARIAAELEASRRKSSERGGGQGDGQSAGSPSSKRQKP